MEQDIIRIVNTLPVDHINMIKKNIQSLIGQRTGYLIDDTQNNHIIVQPNFGELLTNHIYSHPIFGCFGGWIFKFRFVGTNLVIDAILSSRMSNSLEEYIIDLDGNIVRM